MAGVLEKVRKLNWVLQEAPKGNFSFKELCKILSELMDSNVYVMDTDCVLLGAYLNVAEDATITTDPETGMETLPKEYAEKLAEVNQTMANLQNDQVTEILEYEEKTRSKFHTIIPIVGGGERWGTMLLARYTPEFSEEDLVLAEVGATCVGLEIQRVKSLQDEEEAREIEVVRMAISTLSYSETEAVQRIFEELNDTEGILVASKIADKSRITRSVIVNALRKLESAGIIESKSLGMKGTHIKVLNSKFYKELAKLK